MPDERTRLVLLRAGACICPIVGVGPAWEEPFNVVVRCPVHEASLREAQ